MFLLKISLFLLTDQTGNLLNGSYVPTSLLIKGTFDIEQPTQENDRQVGITTGRWKR